VVGTIVTDGDILTALAAADDPPQGDAGMTVGELIEAMGRRTAPETMRARLKQLIKIKAVVVGRSPRQRIDGAWVSVPVYRWIASGG
jgi:hypothetical protein